MQANAVTAAPSAAITDLMQEDIVVLSLCSGVPMSSRRLVRHRLDGCSVGRRAGAPVEVQGLSEVELEPSPAKHPGDEETLGQKEDEPVWKRLTCREHRWSSGSTAVCGRHPAAARGVRLFMTAGRAARSQEYEQAYSKDLLPRRGRFMSF
ncbi:hypothetical protein [Solihabitans fulvus]|uniref:hypothetical protein n=1 Tax=Solihabitans fulvus TaxID=1892852 RepID=UPI001661C37E|nr:hypothetical protein [Solihabitans fulvus]